MVGSPVYHIVVIACLIGILLAVFARLMISWVGEEICLTICSCALGVIALSALVVHQWATAAIFGVLAILAVMDVFSILWPGWSRRVMDILTAVRDV